MAWAFFAMCGCATQGARESALAGSDHETVTIVVEPEPPESEPGVEEGDLETQPQPEEPPPVPCADRGGLIDDMEDGDARSHAADGRGGAWSSYLDEAGSTMQPAPITRSGTPFVMEAPGAAGSNYAAHLHGQLANAGIVFAGMQVNFVGPSDPYDARRYDGIAFLAKKAPSTRGYIAVMVSDVYTLPEGGICTECYNHFEVQIELTEQWKNYAVRFENLRQQPGWGEPRRRRLAVDAVYGVIFQVTGHGAAYDFWVDELRFTGCER